MFAILCLLLCKYLVCELHNSNKTSCLFITSNLNSQLHVTEYFFEDALMKTIMKIYRFVCQFLLQKSIYLSYFLKNVIVCMTKWYLK